MVNSENKEYDSNDYIKALVDSKRKITDTVAYLMSTDNCFLGELVRANWGFQSSFHKYDPDELPSDEI